jgi:hypothetical protein
VSGLDLAVLAIGSLPRRKHTVGDSPAILLTTKPKSDHVSRRVIIVCIGVSTMDECEVVEEQEIACLKLQLQLESRSSI